MIVLAEEKEVQIVIKKSKVISMAKKCNSISEIKKIISEVKKIHPNASHYVHACIVGNEFSYSDDKEPKNTAGKSAFNVFKGSGISNICILIIRYFGGTLLGTGGLVKAYSDSAKLLLKDIKTEEKIKKFLISLKFDYQYYNQIKNTIQKYDSDILEEKFNEKIGMLVSIPEYNKKNMLNDVNELTKSNNYLEIL